MSHPCIVRFETFFEDKVAVYILLELCTNQVCVVRVYVWISHTMFTNGHCVVQLCTQV